MKFSTTLHWLQKAALSDAKNLRDKFYIDIKYDIKNSRLAELIEKKPLNCTNAREFNYLNMYLQCRTSAFTATN